MIASTSSRGFYARLSSNPNFPNSKFQVCYDAIEHINLEIGKLEKDVANQLFESYLTLNLDKQQLDEPGNRYYFMIHKAKGQEHKLQWGYKELTNKTPEIFHKNFMSLVKKLEISTVNSSK